jgi:RNA polymerase sigma factor (sigma-70 family)
MARRGHGAEHHPEQRPGHGQTPAGSVPPTPQASEGTAGAGIPDALLAARAAQGDQQAFDGLYRRHAPSAWRVAHAITGNPHDASDAVAEAFTRVLVALEAGRLENGDRFRSYLLSATRNASLDVTRRSGRSRPTATPETFEGPSHGAGPSDRLVDRLDASLVAAAFRSLPERWRSVLWLTEVEGIPAREAAALLGMSANSVAQLAVRARAGLRERFLQAHLSSDVQDSCRFTVDHLGAYVGGGLAPRDVAKVDQHLAACAGCAARKEELEDMGPSLRRVIVPVPLGLAGLAAARWKGALASARAAKAAHAAGSAVRRSGARHRSARLARGMIRAHRPLMTMSLGLLALSIIGATIVGQQGPLQVPGRLAAPHPGGPGELSISVNPGGVPLTDAAALAPEVAGTAVVAGTEAASAAAARSDVAGTTLSATAPATRTPNSAPAGPAASTGGATPKAAPAVTSGAGAPTGAAPSGSPGTPPPGGGGGSGTPGGPRTPPSGGSGGSPTPPTQPPPPLVQASTSASLGPVTAAAGVGAGSSGACTGATLFGSPVAAGCPQPQPTAPGVSASTSGSLVPAKTVHVP